MNRPEAAIEVLEAICQKGGKPGPIDAVRLLADLYTEQRLWGEALSAYQQIKETSLDPGLRRSISFRVASICEQHLNDLAGAERALNEILEDEPSNTMALERLASVELNAGHRLGARLALTRAINSANSRMVRAQLRNRLAAMDLEEDRPSVL